MSVSSCSQQQLNQPETHRPEVKDNIQIIDNIQIFKATNDHLIPPKLGLTTGPLGTGPYPVAVQQVFNQNDGMFTSITLNTQYTGNVIFSKFTYFNRESGKEWQITYAPGDSGPFEPGQVSLLGFTKPFTVPNETGIYEFRIYRAGEKVASAAFEVKTAVVSAIMIVPVPAGQDIGFPVPGGWERPQNPYPHPYGVQRVFSPNTRMFLGVSINPRYNASVTFSKYTFFSARTAEEREVGFSARETGPFEPGQQVFPAILSPWAVPNEPGVYEIRIYSGNEVVASAVFEVK